MAAKSVATKSDVKTQLSNVPLSPADSPLGSAGWSAGQIEVSSYSQLKIDGAEAIYEARCTFSFSGSNTKVKPPQAVTGPDDKVVLNAAALGRTHLQGLENQVLRDGDSITSADGNTLKIVSSERLRSE
jgi:hypothetical protein